MLLPDIKTLIHKTTMPLVVVLLSLIGLSACQIRPLYGPTTTSAGINTTVQAELAAVQVSALSGHTGQELYNELIFNLERGAQRADKKYQLKIIMNTNITAVGVLQLVDVPSAYSLTVNTTFVLSEIGTNETLMTGRSFATASYDFSNQRFANIRAQRDAETRAANEVADDIHARLAGYFAAR